MLNENIKGVLFDLDQTLCNSEDFYYNELQNNRLLTTEVSNINNRKTSIEKSVEYNLYLYIKEKLKIVNWETFIKCYEKSKSEIKSILNGTAAAHSRYLYIQETFENLGARFSPIDIYNATNFYWDFVIKNMKLFPYVIVTLHKIKSSNIKICIISDLTADIQLKKLKKLKIEKYIDFLVTSEEAGADKPQVNQINIALSKLKLTKEQVIIIGNNPKTDIQLGLNTKINTILFDYNKKFINTETKKVSTFYINNFKDISKILKLKKIKYSNKKLLVFDLIGTLTQQQHIISENLFNLIKIDKNILKQNYDLFKINEISQDKFWKNLNIKDFKKIEQLFLDSINIEKSSINLLKILNKRYQLVLLSNIPSQWGNYICNRFNLKEIFKEFIFNGDVKLAKPNEKIYEIIFKKYKNILHDNIYFIDNELQALSVAQSFLINTIWLNKENEKDINTNFIPDYVINNLNEIRALISKISK